MNQNAQKKSVSKNSKVLRAIVGGYERGGTTLLSQILSAHPKLESGFEAGLLLAPNPSEFLSKKYKTYNGALIRNGWGVTKSDLEYICSAENWNQTYLRLRERSKVLKNKDAFLVDKTPIYMKHLSEILLKIDEVKSVIVIKQPVGVIWSWIKRSESKKPRSFEISNMCSRYMNYAEGYQSACKAHPERVMTVKYSDLCMSPENTVKAICNYLDIEYTPLMLKFTQAYEVHGTETSTNFIDEYKKGLTPQEIAKIIEETNGVFSGF